MGFPEFISNFRYRRQLNAEFQRFQNIKPPTNPSRKYIDKLVKQLLNSHITRNAKRELEMIGPAVVPSLLAALEDPRFHKAKWDEFSLIPAPLDSTLELLVRHSREEVVRIASPLAKSSSTDIRKTVALRLASTGDVRTIPILLELMQDEEGYVRTAVCHGIVWAVKEQRVCPEFRHQAFNMLLPQHDQVWGSTVNKVANTIVVLDPVRSATELADEHYLNSSNRYVHQTIEACNREGILLPEPILRRLLNESLPQAVGKKCYPHQYIAAAALYALSLQQAEGIQPIANSLLDHEHAEIQQAAADALAVWDNIKKPINYVLNQVQQAGYESLSPAQQVVYCAFLFDSEVRNGGLMQFLGNSSGNHTVDTLSALSELQHTAGYTALKTAIELVGPLARESDPKLRLTAFDGRWDELHPAFAPLEKEYYAAQPALEQLWVLYTIRHSNEFQE